jgi:hypothetical protein
MQRSEMCYAIGVVPVCDTFLVGRWHNDGTWRFSGCRAGWRQFGSLVHAEGYVARMLRGHRGKVRYVGVLPSCFPGNIPAEEVGRRWELAEEKRA